MTPRDIGSGTHPLYTAVTTRRPTPRARTREATVRHPAVPVRLAARLRSGDHRAHDRHPRAAAAPDAQADEIDVRAAAHPAEDQGAAGEVQEQQREVAGGDDQVLPGEQ